ERVFVAGPIEQHAAEQMPNRSDDELTLNQHEIRPQLQQRLEIALDVCRSCAELRVAVGLDDLLQMAPRKCDRLIDGAKHALLAIEHDSINELRQGCGATHPGHGLLHVASPAKVGDTI